MTFTHHNSPLEAAVPPPPQVGKKNPGTFSLHPVLQRLFQRRQFSQTDLEDFLTWDLRSLPDLTQIHDLTKAAQKIIDCLKNKKRIGIYGDYDVDGTTSCALFYHFFQLLNVEIELFQPSRFVEGYGLHISSIDQAINQGVHLLITVDCGITNNEAASYAKEKNLDLIITDHHKDVREELPCAYAVVNPNRRDEPSESPLRALAGVGVAFAVCLQVKKQLELAGSSCPSIYPLLQFVAVGTICDLALLSPVNLKLVRHGLKQICLQPYPGLKIFLKPEDTLNKNFVSSEKIAFHIGPLINSKGRLEHPDRALKVLISSTLEMARDHYVHLETSNRERKFIQAEVFQKAKLQVQETLSQFSGHLEELLISIVYDPTWHEGVIGIVASKLVESFKVPAIVLTKNQEGNLLKASARTAGTLDIFHCLKTCQDLFSKFGGHQAAAGFSLPIENLPAFKERMQEQLRNWPATLRTLQEGHDMEVFFEEVTPSLAQSLDTLEPFGRGNAKPIFRMNKVKLESFSILKDLHVRWNFSSQTSSLKGPPLLRGISFHYMGKIDSPSPEELLSKQGKNGLTIQFTLGINAWGGKEYLQLMVDKVSLS